MSVLAGRTVNSSGTSSGWQSLLISLCFWGGLGAAATLAGLLILAPRLVQNDRLQRRLVKNAAQLATLEQETRHRATVARALRTDPDFVARVAAVELNTLPSGTVQVAVGPKLEFDARLPAPADRQWTLPSSWLLPVLESLAAEGPLRQGCRIAAGMLFLLSFCCFNEDFFAGGMRNARSTLLRRYQAARPGSKP